jgi:WASH complex subunit 7
MVRSAGMNAAADAVKFVPDIADLPSFEEAASKVRVAIKNTDAPTTESTTEDAIPSGPGLSPETLEAAKQLDSVLRNLTSNFSEGVDYFTLLVNVFQHVLTKKDKTSTDTAVAPPVAPVDPNNPNAAAPAPAPAKEKEKDGTDSHLRNFFLIIPALTLSFVDSLRTAKERMEKTVKGSEAYFTDDGFPLGLAYILAILRQDRSFESLHWWEEVSAYHASELKKFSAELATLGKSKPDMDKRYV